MRFAYIDSQGNEVSIPSVDALALRVELGAIGPDTQLYDAQADRWGPAHTHEIFHTLSRDASGGGGFVAPPPPVAAPSQSDPVAPDALAPDEPMELGALQPDAPGAGTAPKVPPKRFNVAEDLGLPPEPENDDGGASFDFTLTDLPALDPSDTAEDPGSGSDLDLAFSAPSGDAGTPADDAGSFDFGDLSSLELEEGPIAEPEPPASVAGGLPGGGTDLGSLGVGDGERGGGAGTMDFSGGLDLEQPMSEFTSDGPSSWMAPSASDEEADEGAMSFAGGTADAEEEEEEEERRPGSAPRAARDSVHGAPASERTDRSQPRSRPSPPRRARRRSPVGAIVGVLVLAAVAGGGYYGYTHFLQGSGRSTEVAAPVALPPVVIPDIPAELLPRMRDMGQAALGAMMAQLNDERVQSGLPAEPNRDWLAGVYLANAARFRDVQEYWEGIGAFVDQVRDGDTRVFHDQYVARLAEAGITGDTASILLARADSGFLATRQDRFEAYAQMDDLVNAALDLHRFLLQNEANIQYTPAAGGVSEDPVLEAVPASKELGREMWGMVDRITSALDALGTLDKVTTERLSAVLFDRIRRAGFQ